MDIGTFNLENCTSDFEVVTDPYLVQLTLFPFCRQPEPGPVCGSNVGQQETRCLVAVANLGMEVTHLRVFLDAECIVGVATNRQSKLVNRNDSVPRGALEHIQFAHRLLGRSDDFEFTKAHLKHHVGLQMHFRSNHDKRACGGPNVPQVKVGDFSIGLRVGVRLCDKLNFTVASGYEALRDYHIVARRVAAKSGPVVTYDVHIVKQLALGCSKNENVIWLHHLRPPRLLHLQTVVCEHRL